MAKNKTKPGRFWTPAELENLRRDLIADPVMTMEEKISLDRAIAKVIAEDEAEDEKREPVHASI